MSAMERRPGRRAARPLAWAACWALACGPSFAGSDLYGRPNGFWLLPSDHSQRLYGPSRPDANWNIAQWDIPEDLPPFSDGRTRNRFAAVSIHPDGSYDLSQQGEAMPCAKRFPSGNVLTDEFDLFASPNDLSEAGYPQARRQDAADLADLAELRVGIGLEVDAFATSDRVCPRNQAGLILAVVATDAAAKQVLFYQVRLAEFRTGARGVEQPRQPGVWFATGGNPQSGQGGQYGFGEDVAALGDRYPGLGARHRFDLDLLPRLRDLIREGARYGMDPDLGRWRLTGTYHGIRSFGHVSVASTWTGFSLSSGPAAGDR